MEQIIVDFAKTNKIARAKAEAFAQQIIEQYTAAHPVKTTGGGRPVSDATIALRESVVLAVRMLQAGGAKATVQSILPIVGLQYSPVYINNALVWNEEQGRVKRNGKAEKQGKGKKPTVWVLA